MTFRTKVWTLGSVIFVLAVLLVVGAVFSVQTRGLAQTAEPLLPSLKASSVTDIAIAVPDGKDSARIVNMRKSSDGRWWVSGEPAAGASAASAAGSAPAEGSASTGGTAAAPSTVAQAGSYPGDGTKIDTFLRDLSALQTTRTVTTNQALYASFDLDQQHAKSVTLTAQGGRRIVLYYGKDALGGGYVRLGNDPSVYLADKSLSYYLNRGAQSWYRLRLYPDSLSNIDVQLFEVQYLSAEDSAERALVKQPEQMQSQLPASVRSSGYRLVRRAAGSNGNNWFYEGDLTLALDQPQVESVVREVLKLSGTDFAPPSVSEISAGVNSPGIRITFQTGEGKQYTLSIGHQAGKDTFYVLPQGPDVEKDSTGKPFIYVASRFYLERALKPVAALVKSGKPAASGG